ncbi:MULTISPECIES: C39 family peptidase [Marinobacter]|jgi:predicted double-glycine peptidase|uniref:C39 family peptidase n=1 Tax=Marinobacter TaxID=2742 RepID=UPI0020039777|nr:MULTISPECIES: C39 family peptidase [Marinobacter]MCK7549887.1 C39 family peptidase [Marinobacter goseongensis]MDV3503355.1 C39 family peptidase [Marinobacter sp. M-5]
MLLVLAGSILTFTMVQEATVVEPFDRETVVIEQDIDSGPVKLRTDVRLEPLVEQKFRNIVRQAYDYSCGSAALTTVLNHYLGRTLNERQVMEGLLHYGESERIVQRRAFSMLDMKRLVTALGYPSGGFRASIEDLIDLDHPAIVPIEHAGFKHFVVLRTIRDGRVYLADPAVGNISFTLAQFEEKWNDNVLFIVFPGSDKPLDYLELKEEDLRFVDDQTLTLLALQQAPLFHEATARRIQNLLERQKNNPDGSVENTRKQLHYRRN